MAAHAMPPAPTNFPCFRNGATSDGESSSLGHVSSALAWLDNGKEVHDTYSPPPAPDASHQQQQHVGGDRPFLEADKEDASTDKTDVGSCISETALSASHDDELWPYVAAQGQQQATAFVRDSPARPPCRGAEYATAQAEPGHAQKQRLGPKGAAKQGNQGGDNGVRS
eukprot:TRINITY_DN28938_c0_g1_i3.p2 TRINITY_DN28938_c0_g1~~TRINITY_DN28938_c0_g1_i3.p2  ORF type:complete len:178 (-),score=26.42 TRINITY_DN28938_c0_g1_i3:78-581(-)